MSIGCPHHLSFECIFVSDRNIRFWDMDMGMVHNPNGHVSRNLLLRWCSKTTHVYGSLGYVLGNGTWNGFGSLKLDQTVHINFLGDLVDYWSESCMKYNEMLNSLTMSMWCVKDLQHRSLDFGCTMEDSLRWQCLVYTFLYFHPLKCHQIIVKSD